MKEFPKDQIRMKITRGIAGWEVLIETASSEVHFRAQSVARTAQLVSFEVDKMLKELAR